MEQGHVSEIVSILQQYEILKEFSRKKWLYLPELKSNLVENRALVACETSVASLDLVLMDYLEQEVIADRLYKISHTYLDLYGEKLTLTLKGQKILEELEAKITEMYIICNK